MNPPTDESREAAKALVKSWLAEDCKERATVCEGMSGSMALTGRIAAAIDRARREGKVDGIRHACRFWKLSKWDATQKEIIHPLENDADRLEREGESS